MATEFLAEQKEILDYITIDLKAGPPAFRLNKKIIEHVLLLRDMPEMFAKIEKFHRAARQYRRIVVNHYCILYTIDYENRIIYIAHMYYLKRNYINELP